MSSSPILRTKLVRPQVPADFVVRQHLRQRLDEGRPAPVFRRSSSPPHRGHGSDRVCSAGRPRDHHLDQHGRRPGRPSGLLNTLYDLHLPVLSTTWLGEWNHEPSKDTSDEGEK
jgi:hypothetical protein